MAEEGLVEFRSGEEVWFKHIDDLVREDRRARIETESARVAYGTIKEGSRGCRVAAGSKL